MQNLHCRHLSKSKQRPGKSDADKRPGKSDANTAIIVLLQAAYNIRTILEIFNLGIFKLKVSKIQMSSWLHLCGLHSV